MSKRSNPYVEDFMPQSKTHVGLKQFNNNEDRMRKVYEKTLALLFKGAKKFPDLGIKGLDEVSLARKDSMKQLIINKNGTLENSSPIECGKRPQVAECVCGSRAAELRCSYCEVSLCSACQHLCERCSLCFCSKCSLIGSEGAEICVSCYG